jgi:ribulose bisphosphate carboxylase small subunit
MKVWPPIGKKKFETLSYLPDLSDVELAKEVDYLLRNKWIPCVEFEPQFAALTSLSLSLITPCGMWL